MVANFCSIFWYLTFFSLISFGFEPNYNELDANVRTNPALALWWLWTFCFSSAMTMSTSLRDMAPSSSVSTASTNISRASLSRCMSFTLLTPPPMVPFPAGNDSLAEALVAIWAYRQNREVNREKINKFVPFWHNLAKRAFGEGRRGREGKGQTLRTLLCLKKFTIDKRDPSAVGQIVNSALHLA